MRRKLLGMELGSNGLLSNTSFLQDLMTTHPDPLFILDEHGQFLQMNQRFVRLLNGDVEKLSRQHWLEFVSDNKKYAQQVIKTALEGKPTNFSCEILTITKNVVSVHITFIPLMLEDKRQAVFAIIKERSSELALQQRFNDQEQLLYSLLQYNTNAIFVIDETGLFIHVNSAAELITGYKKTELYDMHFIDLIKIRDRQTVLRRVRKALNGEGQSCEITLNHRLDKETYVDVIFVPNIIDGVVKGVIGIAEDITNKKAMEQRLSQMAEEDPLTGLPNRRYFMRELETSLASAKRKNDRVAVLFIDIDHFKLINDTLGHAFGDEAIILLVSRLHKLIQGKAKLARMGGDEFVVLLPHIQHATDAIAFAEEICANMSEPLDLNNYEFSMTTSIGIALYPDSATDATTLIRCADAAMHRAKGQAIEKCQLYSDEMSRSFNEWFKVENDLRKALERNEFELFYQPQYCLKSDKICGVEVLVRWHHPKDGLISPARFISVAEETGLIVPLGEWILREACKQMRIWLDGGLPVVPISVNLSLRQFMYKDIAETVGLILEETGLPPTLLDLEITESVTIDLNRSLTVLEQLKELGVRISLDDFGTGYSSLQYLAKFPIDELKIDQSFVKKILSNDNSKAIVTMIINLAHLLDLKVVAEGVEMEEQIDFLRKHGCDVVQGYFFHKPLTSKEYELILKEGWT